MRRSWAVGADEKAVERYYARLPLPTRVIARDLDEVARAAIPQAIVGIKWSVPFYARKGPICYVSAAKEHVTFGLLQGVDVRDASDLLTGTGKSPIRKAIFAAGERVPRAIVRGWLKHAVQLDDNWGQH